MTDITSAIKELRPNSSFGVRGSTIIWNDPNNTQPTEKEINDKIAELQAAYEATQYQRDRSTSYPSLQDQLDMQYWDSVNGTTTWKDAIAKVKTDIPKPSE